ncbi:MAG: class I SAM-dependent methyltransferase [Rudaea sp.]
MPDPRSLVFDRLAPLWDAEFTSPDDRPRLEQIVHAARIAPGDCVLDLGTGTGALIPAILSTRPRLVLGADLSHGMLSRLQEKHNGAEVAPVDCDGSCLPLAGSTCHALFCNGVWPHFESPARVAGELFRVAAPGARLIVSHVIGRERLNVIHASAEDEILRADYLPPAAQVAAVLEAAGWRVTDCQDTNERFLVAAVKG